MVKGVGFKPLFFVAFARGQYYNICQRGHCNSKTNYPRKGEPIKNLMLLSGTKPVSPLFSVSFLRHNCLNLCGHTNLVVSSTCSLYVQQTDILFLFLLRLSSASVTHNSKIAFHRRPNCLSPPTASAQRTFANVCFAETRGDARNPAFPALQRPRRIP